MFAERAPREVHRLAQVRARGLGVQVGPEQLHHLLAVQPMARRDGEQLYQGRPALAPPGVPRNGTIPNDYSELPEEVHP